MLDSPHSGESYPGDFDHLPPRNVVRQAEDTHVARLWSFAPAVGATLLEAEFPRAYIDPNRSLADIMNAPLIRCDQVQWELVGISMAGWNAILSFLAALVILWLSLKPSPIRS